MVIVQEDLKLKTITGISEEEIDKKYNEFAKDNKVRFTQTNQFIDDGGRIRFVASLFYLDKKAKETTVSESMSYNKLKEISEKDAKWCNCGKCGSPWKYTHFKMCPKRHGIEHLPEDALELYKEIWG